MKQFTLDVGPDTSPTLENFHIEPANAALHQHLRLWLGESAQHRRSSLPVYLWGETSSGKTHLLKALQSVLTGRGERVGWMDSTIAEPPSFDDAWRVVLLDDVHRYSAVQQHAAFNWLINTQSKGAAVVATGDAAPAQLLVRDDLRTRLGWGDVFACEALSDKACEQVLLASASQRGLQMGADVLNYLATRFSRDLGVQMEWLDRLDAYALQAKRAITLPLLKEMMINYE